MTAAVRPPLKHDDLVALGVDAQSAADWIAARKDRGAKTLTVRAWGLLVKEAQRAGISPAAAVEFCAEKGWQSFHAEGYLQERRRTAAPAAAITAAPARPMSFDEANRQHRATRMALLTGGRAPAQPTTDGEDLRSAAEIMGATTNARRIAH